MPASGFRVEDLLRSPALQLRLIAGAGGTGRRVSWAHVSELEDPTPWLSGAEMIMTTGMAVPRGGEAQRAYLERLDDAGVACLALSEGLFVPPVTALLAAADRRGFPIVEVPIPVPFITIAQEVRPRSRWTTRSGSTPSCRCSGRCAGWPPACPPWRSSPGWNGCRAIRCTRAHCSGGRCSTGSRCHRSITPELIRARPPARRRCREVTCSRSPGRAGRPGTSWPWSGPTPCPGRRLGGAAHRDRGGAAAVHARP